MPKQPPQPNHRPAQRLSPAMALVDGKGTGEAVLSSCLWWHAQLTPCIPTHHTEPLPNSTEQPDTHSHGSAPAQAQPAAAPGLGACASCGKLADPWGFMENEGAQSQAPWQTALIRANDCTSPLPGCFTDTAINSSEATSLAAPHPCQPSQPLCGLGLLKSLLVSLAGGKQSSEEPNESMNPHRIWGSGCPSGAGGSTSTQLSSVWEQLWVAVGIFSSAATIESSF